MTNFLDNSFTGNPVFYRTYSRFIDGKRENWEQVCDRTLKDTIELGKLNDDEVALISIMQRDGVVMPSGRWLWVGGTEWIKKPENFSGAYNCTSTVVDAFHSFGLMMDLAMMGSGTGAVLEFKNVELLSIIKTKLNVKIVGQIGSKPAEFRQQKTSTDWRPEENVLRIVVGDSRQGWVNTYTDLLYATTLFLYPLPNGDTIDVEIDLSNIRPEGEPIRGFGGVSQPAKLPDFFQKIAKITNGAVGRQLTSIECCLLIDEAAVVVVAGNVRRSAGMRQFSVMDVHAAAAKDNLWQQDENGNWRIDPNRDALRMANHTIVHHRKPTLEDCVAAVRKQYYSGEGAIQWAGEAVARASADLITTPEEKRDFIAVYEEGEGQEWLTKKDPNINTKEAQDRLQRYGLNPCVTADTWIHTGDGARQVKELIGCQHSTYVNGELFSTTPDGFFSSGIKPVVKLTTQEGYELRLTSNHRILKVTTQTQKAQYTEWVEVGQLTPGDKVLVHNHRNLTPWGGQGTESEGWLLGNLLANGCIASNSTAYLKYWGVEQIVLKEYAHAAMVETGVIHKNYEWKFGKDFVGDYDTYTCFSNNLLKLAKNYGMYHGHKQLTPAIEKASYEFYQGFLRGLFDGDGSVQGNHTKGISVRLSQSNLELLQAVQRMLIRLGISAVIYTERRPEGKRLLPNSNRQLVEYFCKASHELVIANDNLSVFAEVIGFQHSVKSQRLQESLSSYKRCLNRERFGVTVAAITPDGTEEVYDCTVPGSSQFDANGFVSHNCGEIILSNNHCNLSEVHLNMVEDYNSVIDAFKAAALQACALLHHKFVEPRYQHSREVDPIVGVSFTGLFDYFVKFFGTPWLEWWSAGRPNHTGLGKEFLTLERTFLEDWRLTVVETVNDYCDRHHIKRPNRCTTVQPAGTKSLLTGASPGWHPPKAQRFIRRVTFRKNDPVALACMDYGYSAIPSQSDKDENGHLLNDPFDSRCTEWLIEIPIEVPWANYPGVDRIDISKFSALAQFDFYMQVQKFYTQHNTSATIELREPEIEALGKRIYEAIRDDEGYISAALLARFDNHQSFPRMPFEPIDKKTYDKLHAKVLQRRQTVDFAAALAKFDQGESVESGPAGCDSDKCLFPSQPTVENQAAK